MAEAPFRETQPAEPIEQNNKCTSITMAVATAFLLVGAAVSVVSSLNVDSDDTVDYAVELQNATETFFSSPSDHSPLIPLQPTDVWGFTLAALGLILASGGGIGGGGMLVPIYILVLGFLPKHAIPLSNVTVFGGAVANTWWNVKRRHPSADR